MAGAAAGYVRDPIHGLIPLSRTEAEVLALPLLSRLKGIRQMGFAWAVFPGANHTRFEHSVGVMHAAGLLVRDLPGATPRDVRLLRLAGLVHDVGHPPFSHTLELAARLYGGETGAEELARLRDHEETTRERVAQDPGLRRVLQAHPDYRDLRPEEVADLAVGRHRDRSWSALIHGEIDADRIDYILRDNHHCGFPSGLDAHLLPSLLLRRPGGEIVLNSERAYFAEQLLLARYHLQVKIHDEPRNRLADLLLAGVLRDFFRAADRGARREFHRVVTEGGDAELLALLRRHVPRGVAALEEHLAGRSPVVPLGEVGFEEVSPAGRYALSLLLSADQRDESVRMARLLSQRLGTEVTADVWGATPPGPTFRTAGPEGRPAPIPLTELPLVRATVQATHRAMGVRLYVPREGPAARPDLAGAQERYQARVDSLFDAARSRRLKERLDPGEVEGLAVSLELEASLMETLLAAHGDGPYGPDALLLALHALFEAFAGPPLREPRVFLDGVDGFAPLLEAARLPRHWKAAYGTPLPYAVPVTPGRVGGPDPDLVADLEELEAYGLLARLPRLERRGRRFHARDRFALTGWGRGLVGNVLLQDPRLEKVHARALEGLRALVTRRAGEFEAFFGMVGRADAGARSQRHRLRGDRPLPVSK